MSDLAAFLLARLDEREEHMEHLRASEARTGVQWVVETRTPVNESTETVRKVRLLDPAHELADIAAKRAIIAEHPNQNADWPEDDEYSLAPICGRCEDRRWHDAAPWPCPTLKALAQPYAGHPDFDPAWRTG